MKKLICTLVVLSLFQVTLSQQAKKFCFTLQGLKYTNKFIVQIEGNKCYGYVLSEIDEDVQKEEFTGTVRADLITVKFNSKKPIIGAQSELTDNPWKIFLKSGASHLLIPVYAKNFQTGKWTNEYFTADPCKNFVFK